MGGYFIILLSNGLKYATTHTRLKPPTTTHKYPQPPKSYQKIQNLPQTVLLLHFRC